MRYVTLLLILLLLVPAEARTKDSNSTTTVWYDNRFNQGNDLDLDIQFKANVTSLEIILDFGGNSESIFYGTYQNTKTNTIIQFTVDRELLAEAGEYQLRFVTEIFNSSIIDQLFIQFTVLKVLQGPEIMMAIGLISLLVFVPFAYDADKRKLDSMGWERLSFKAYLQKRVVGLFKSWKFWLVVVILVISGFFVWRYSM